jgi:UDP-N-acetylglucosamine 2-epimerase (non-hydrolysing)/GDP/UDP-N,N'-diacetylbacillosamine 2-epimerase (hydrolysing)
MRTIGVVTVGRSDFGLYRWVLREIRATKGLHLKVYVTGMHLSPEFGLTVDHVRSEGFKDIELIESLLSSDTPVGIAKSMGLGTVGFADSFGRSRPDLLLVLGDRFEMHAAVLASLPFKIPVAHIHGGEITEGAIDDALRHCITKLSHLHFPASQTYAARIRQMGEESWRIVVSGAPSLDNLRKSRIAPRSKLMSSLRRPLADDYLLVTYHPVTLEYERADWQIEELLSALESLALPVLFTMPNADTNGRMIRAAIEKYVDRHPESQWVENLGGLYFTAMANAVAMVGNSSSGLIEAASFRLPVVNIGTRQHGRERPTNVIDCGNRKEEIQRAVRRACQKTFKGKHCSGRNPQDAGGAAKIIARTLLRVRIDDHLTRKKFIDLNGRFN